MRDAPGEFMLLDQRALKLLRDLINQRSGIHYEDDKLDLLADKLEGRAAELGLTSFEEYYHYLTYDPGGQAEWHPLFDAVTVNETYFMREADQLKAFVEMVVPEIQGQSGRSSLLVWSAACATGEEPYSLAMLLLERGMTSLVRIIASDISQRALDLARRGVYSRRSLRAIPPDMANRYLVQNSANWTVDGVVKDLVSFKQINLLDDNLMRSVRGMDAIFCRNAFIYFDQPSVQRVVDYFYAALNPGGYLFVGAAESLLRISSDFKLVEIGGAFAYRKS